jgi:hypothetical protein
MPAREGAVEGARDAGGGDPRGSVVPPGADTAGDPVRIGDGPPGRSERASSQGKDAGSPSIRSLVMPRSTTAALAKANFRVRSLTFAPWAPMHKSTSSLA